MATDKKAMPDYLSTGVFRGKKKKAQPPGPTGRYANATLPSGNGVWVVSPADYGHDDYQFHTNETYVVRSVDKVNICGSPDGKIISIHAYDCEGCGTLSWAEIPFVITGVTNHTPHPTCDTLGVSGTDSGKALGANEAIVLDTYTAYALTFRGSVYNDGETFDIQFEVLDPA